jgi:hypothetical protein
MYQGGNHSIPGKKPEATREEEMKVSLKPTLENERHYTRGGAVRISFQPQFPRIHTVDQLRAHKELGLDEHHEVFGFWESKSGKVYAIILGILMPNIEEFGDCPIVRLTGYLDENVKFVMTGMEPLVADEIAEYEAKKEKRKQ